MIKPIRLLVLLLFFASFSNTIEAQIWRKIKNKVQKKAEEKIDKETDKVIDKALKGNQKKAEGLQTIYKFNQSIVIEFSADKGNKAELELFFNSNNKNMVCMTLDPEKTKGMGGDIYNIITPKGITMFMNMPGMKVRKSMSNKEFSQFDNSKKIPTKDDLIKTGNIKSILGFACHEYTYENDGGTITAWVTKENFPIDGRFVPMLGMKDSGPFEGFVMELAFKATNENGNVKIVKINKNKSITINTKEYKSMGF